MAQLMSGFISTHLAGIRGKQANVVETTGDCHIIQVNIEVRAVTLSISDHGHDITDGRVVASFDTEKRGLTCTRSWHVDVTVPLPVLSVV